MAGRTWAGSSPRQWATFLYILLVFLLPFALLNTAHGQDDEKVSKENLGDGTLPYWPPQLCAAPS